LNLNCDTRYVGAEEPVLNQVLMKDRVTASSGRGLGLRGSVSLAQLGENSGGASWWLSGAISMISLRGEKERNKTFIKSALSRKVGTLPSSTQFASKA
jgi:hypothetical protein